MGTDESDKCDGLLPCPSHELRFLGTVRRPIVREFDDAAQEFLSWAKMEYRSHPNSHRRLAMSLASAREFFARKPVSTINESEIEAYKVWRFSAHQVRDITVRHDLHALSTFFKYSIKQHWAQANPILSTKIPSDADAVRIHVISPQEEREYFSRAAKNQNLYDLAQLMRNQGMRPEEVLSLRKQDVDLERRQLKIRSGKSKAAQRTLDLTSESLAIVASRWHHPSVWVFPSDRISGGHLVRMNSAHDRICREKKGQRALHFVLYDFRHTFATRMAQAVGLTLRLSLPSSATIPSESCKGTFTPPPSTSKRLCGDLKRASCLLMKGHPAALEGPSSKEDFSPSAFGPLLASI
jgi:integrase